MIGPGDPRLVATFKTELRRTQRTTRRALPAEARRMHARAAAERLLDALGPLAEGTIVAGYVAHDGELDPAPALDRLRTRGVSIALPRVERASGTVHLVLDDRPRVVGAYGIAEPPEDAPRVDPGAVCVVLVPGVAFDPSGTRLGFGAGYYDRLLPTLTAARRIGYGYDFQLVSELPREPHDVPVHRIVTERRVLETGIDGPLATQGG